MKKMTNVKEKLAKSREICENMSDDMYLLTDYVSIIANDELYPMGLVMLIVCVQKDIEMGFNSFERKKFPKKIRARKGFILDQIKFFPQVIDDIADYKFAQEFRIKWESVFHTAPPKRMDRIGINKYPNYIKVAVNWWSNAILCPQFDNGKKEQTPFISFIYKNNDTQCYSEDEIITFKQTLARVVESQITESGECYIEYNDKPCDALKIAGKEIGLKYITGYPCNTYMYIDSKIVTVREAFTKEEENLWKSST